jgi:hypothetical protein
MVALAGQLAPGSEEVRFDALSHAAPDNNGEVVYAGLKVLVRGFGGPVYELIGIYRFSGGVTQALAVPGTPFPGPGDEPLVSPTYSFGRFGDVIIADLSVRSQRYWLLSNGVVRPVEFFLDGRFPANTVTGLWWADIRGSGPLLMTGYVLSSAGTPPGCSRSDCYRTHFFIANPIESSGLTEEDFEETGTGNLPRRWSISWSNSGAGEATLYASGGVYSYSGNRVLRLHVGPGGGSTFVLSDPLPVQPAATYTLSAQMRYALESDSDLAAFTILQYDEAGKEIDISELDGTKEDNRWTWVMKSLFVRTLPETRYLRIRFGLLTAAEAYMDIDALR